jgi:hypothetical protein
MIYGFGTRPATNTVVENFLNSTEHHYYKNVKNMQPYEMSFWPDFVWHKWIEQKIPIAVLGILRGTEQLLWRAKENKINYYYIDHAYFFRADKHINNKITNERSYRVCLNTENLNFLTNKSLIDVDYARIEKNKNLMFPRKVTRKSGKRILVCPPSFAIGRYYKFENGVQTWLDNVIKIIKSQTDKEICFRFKESRIPLMQDLEDVYCVVTYQSTMAIEAILNGVPVYCDESSSSAPVSNTHLNISQTYFPTNDEIENWIINLLANQFTIEEMNSGLALNTVQRLQGDNYIK